MKARLLVAVVALAVVPSASASSKLAQQVRTAATRAGFSGEVAVAHNGRIVFAHGYVPDLPGVGPTFANLTLADGTSLPGLVLSAGSGSRVPRSQWRSHRTHTGFPRVAAAATVATKRSAMSGRAAKWRWR